MVDLEQLWQIRAAVRERKPLVYNITNNVVTNFTANVLLACGASPIMSEGWQEADELAGMADVLVLNMGTLHGRQVDYFLRAGKSANASKTPVVFDPVGVGATTYRNEVAAEIMRAVQLTLIRGNYGEISFLTGLSGRMKGVDSLGSGINVPQIQELARKADCLVAATGETDYLTDGQVVYGNNTGNVLLQYVTGSGCALTSLTGAFLAVTADKSLGVLAALAFYGAAAEKAAAVSGGPGSFAVNLLDALYSLKKDEFRAIAENKLLTL